MEEDRILSRLVDSACQVAASTVGQLREIPRLDADGAHDFRVATKCLRSYWILASPAVTHAVAKSYRDDLRDAARPLAAHRDEYVRDRLLRRLAQRAGKKTAGSILFIRDDLFRDEAREHAPDDFDIESAVETLLTDADRWRELEHLTADVDAREILEGFQGTYAQARRIGEYSLVIDTPQGYHRWRRWTKYAYYQYAWLRSVYPQAHEPTEWHLKRLGSMLGRLHDVHHLLAEMYERSTETSSPKAFRRTRDRLLAREVKLKEKVRKRSRKALRREAPLVVHGMLEAMRASSESTIPPDLEFISLADYEGDGAAAAARAADSY